tara:strand:+ start:7549 stop:10113 length:2565 start_codon:yes stop_codon:yes gene_type:complete
MEKYFESTLISSDGKTYRVDLFGENYIGLNAAIIGGSGAVVYVDNDWTDYLDSSQDVVVDASIFGVSFIAYNSASNRTEITLSGGFTYGSQTTIKNDFDGVNSFVPVFNPKIIDIQTEWQDVDENIVSPLMPSETTIKYANVQEVRTTVDTAFFDRFLESYLQSDDDELKVAVYSVSGGTASLEWAGNLVVDLIEWSNESSPREYTFKAIDGINRLKNVFYNGNLNSLAVVKVIDVIKDVLSLNGLTSLWSDTDGYIAEAIEYQSPDVTSVTTSDSILDYTYIPENLLIPKDRDNSEVEFMTGYDVLYGVLELFSCKMVHAEGRYWITQVRNYDGTQFIYRLFNKANNTYTTTFKTHLITNLRNQSGGKFTYYFGINRVSIETESAEVVNIGGNINGWDVQWKSPSTTRLETDTGTIITPPELDFSLGDLPTGSILTIQLNYFAQGLLSNYVDADISLYITSGNKFLKGGNGTAPYWGEDLVTTNRFWIKNIHALAGQDGTLEFTTPVLPADMDSALITFVFDANIVGSTMATFTDVLTIRGINVLTADSTTTGLETIYVNNTNTKFTKDLNLDNLIINEGDTLVTANGLSVHTNYNTGGTAIISRFRFWDGDFPAEGTLSTLRVLEAMSLQYRPIERYLGGFVGDYSPIESIDYNDKTFVCKRVIKSYGMDENNGDWFESTSSRVGLSSNNNQGWTNGEVYNEGLRVYIGNKDGVGVLNTTMGETATTTMIVNLTDDVKIGDTLNFLNSENKEVIGEVVLTENHSAGSAVTVLIESYTPTGPIPAGVEVVNAFKKLSTSEVYRFKTVQHDGTMGVPTIAAPMLANEVRYVAGNVFIESAGDVYKLTGTIYVPE